MNQTIFDRYYPFFAKDYDFHFCAKDEIDDVVNFINNYWKRDHALVRSRVLMDWQHYDAVNQRYNFSLARYKLDNKIHALIGFIPTSQFDNDITHSLLCGAIWLSREDIAMPGLGVMVESFMIKNVPHLLTSGIGLSEDTIAIHKSRKDRIELMKRFFIINDSKTDFHLCKVPGLQSSWNIENGNDHFQEFFQSDYLDLDSSVFTKMPEYKSKEYYSRRFFEHPIYQYHAMGVFSAENVLRAIMFWRFCEHDGARCIRIVDYIGDGSEMVGNYRNFQQLLDTTNSEFIDFIEYGLPDEALKNGGWSKIDETEAVLANYFEPFELCNVDLSFIIPHELQNYPIVVFKGDADQDRPNLIL